MKFACDTCRTKYSISDERVRGRVLKIRCKKCDFVITVREDHVGVSEAAPNITTEDVGRALDLALGAEAATPGAALEADDWYLSFDGEQEGPSSLVRAIERLREQQGSEKEAHAWRPGFLVWLPIEEVPELAVARAVAKPAPRPPLRAMTPTPIGAGRSAGPLAQGQVAKDPNGPRVALSVSAGTSTAPALPAKSAPPIPSAALAPAPAPVAVVTNGRGPHTNGSDVRPAPVAAARDLFADSGAAAMFPDEPDEEKKQEQDGPELSISNEASGLVNLAHLTAAAMGRPTGPVFINGHTGRVPLARAPDPVLDDHPMDATTAPIPVVVVAGAAPRGANPVFKWAAMLFVLVSLGLGGFVVYLLTHRPAPDTIIVTEPARRGDDTPITVTDATGTRTIVNDGKKGATVVQATKKPGPRVAPTAPTSVNGKPDNMSGSQKALADLYKDDGDRATPHAITGAGGGHGGPAGQVSNAAIIAAVSANKRTLSLCYERALKHDSSLKSGRVPIQVSVGISGRVTSVSIPEQQYASSELGQCFVQSVKRWNFPASESPYNTEFPFILQGQ